MMMRLFLKMLFVNSKVAKDIIAEIKMFKSWQKVIECENVYEKQCSLFILSCLPFPPETMVSF